MADWLRRRSSALWQTGYRGGRLQHDGCRLVEEEVVCSVADWLRRRLSALYAKYIYSWHPIED
jgi:hypothetical protein